MSKKTRRIMLIGAPSSGKSTLLLALQDHYKRRPERPTPEQEKAERSVRDSLKSQDYRPDNATVAGHESIVFEYDSYLIDDVSGETVVRHLMNRNMRGKIRDDGPGLVPNPRTACALLLIPMDALCKQGNLQAWLKAPANQWVGEFFKWYKPEYLDRLSPNDEMPIGLLLTKGDRSDEKVDIPTLINGWSDKFKGVACCSISSQEDSSLKLEQRHTQLIGREQPAGDEDLFDWMKSLCVPPKPPARWGRFGVLFIAVLLLLVAVLYSIQPDDDDPLVQVPPPPAPLTISSVETWIANICHSGQTQWRDPESIPGYVQQITDWLGDEWSRSWSKRLEALRQLEPQSASLEITRNIDRVRDSAKLADKLYQHVMDQACMQPHIPPNHPVIVGGRQQAERWATTVIELEQLRVLADATALVCQAVSGNGTIESLYIGTPSQRLLPRIERALNDVRATGHQLNLIDPSVLLTIDNELDEAVRFLQIAERPYREQGLSISIPIQAVELHAEPSRTATLSKIFTTGGMTAENIFLHLLLGEPDPLDRGPNVFRWSVVHPSQRRDLEQRSLRSMLTDTFSGLNEKNALWRFQRSSTQVRPVWTTGIKPPVHLSMHLQRPDFVVGLGQRGVWNIFTDLLNPTGDQLITYLRLDGSSWRSLAGSGRGGGVFPGVPFTRTLLEQGQWQLATRASKRIEGDERTESLKVRLTVDGYPGGEPGAFLERVMNWRADVCP